MIGKYSRSYLFCLCVFFVVFSLEEFDGFHNGNNQEADTEGNDIFCKTYTGKAKGVCQERNFGYCGSGGKCSNGGDPKCFVVRVQGEHATALRAHVKAVKNFCHGHGEERHCHATWAVGNFQNTRFQIMTDEVGKKNQNGYGDALVCDICAHTT